MGGWKVWSQAVGSYATLWDGDESRLVCDAVVTIKITLPVKV